MIRATLRLRVALWALLNAERLLTLHFDMLRESRHAKERQQENERRKHATGAAWNNGRGLIASRVVYAIDDMPGADANRRAL